MKHLNAVSAQHPESLSASAPALWLMGIAALFMAVGAITLHLANALNGLIPGLSFVKLVALYAGWSAAWQALDQTEIAALLAACEQGEPVRLTLCGERSATSWTNDGAGSPGLLGRLAGLFQRRSRIDLAQLLKQL